MLEKDTRSVDDRTTIEEGIEMSNWYKKHQDTLSVSDKVADKVTAFAGTMKFIYVHFVWWIIWFVVNSSLFHLTFDRYPYNLLTMVLSLEAILLGTLILIAQNRQAARDKIQAEHQYEHQEKQLKINTDLTQVVHDLTEEIHKTVVDKPQA